MSLLSRAVSALSVELLCLFFGVAVPFLASVGAATSLDTGTVTCDRIYTSGPSRGTREGWALAIALWSSVLLICPLLRVWLALKDMMPLWWSRAQPSVRGVSALVVHTACVFGLWYAYVTISQCLFIDSADSTLLGELLEGVYQMTFVLTGVGYVGALPTHAYQKAHRLDDRGCWLSRHCECFAVWTVPVIRGHASEHTASNETA